MKMYIDVRPFEREQHIKVITSRGDEFTQVAQLDNLAESVYVIYFSRKPFEDNLEIHVVGNVLFGEHYKEEIEQRLFSEFSAEEDNITITCEEFA